MGFLVGGYNDQIFILWQSWCMNAEGAFNATSFCSYYAYPYGIDINVFYSQPILWGVFFLLARVLGGVTAYNILIFLGGALGLLFSYLLFRKWFSFYVSVSLALSYALSSYFFVHVGSHVDLSQIWVFPAFLLIFLKAIRSQKLTYYLFSGLFISVTLLISNYYGYFLYLLSLLFFFIEVIKPEVFRNGKKLLWKVFAFAVMGISSLIVAIPFVTPYFRANFISNTQDSLEENKLKVVRPIEDFFIFSSRPWHFLLPSTRNPFFGKFSEEVISQLERKDYFLFKNYFHDEHAGLFLGLSNLLLMIFSVYLFFKSQVELKDREVMLKMLFVLFMLILFSFPPYFAVSQSKIYLPSYALYLFFPMFRVLSRLGVIILLVTLFISGFGLSYIEKKIPNILFLIILLLLTSFGLVQSFVPVRLTNVSVTPPVFTFLRYNTSKDSVIAVYPYTEGNKVLFWMREHQRRFANPRGFHIGDFDSAEFTSKLKTDEGLDDARISGINYLLVFKSSSAASLHFFKGSEQIRLLKEFDDSYIYTFN
ncbi:hypothetical protein A2716_03615 [candidate division WWE3 bacterium RIFCSPHIGHO2_01_FULL_40_23]|uniref:Glycosyltransferase RgtA/B/C/D-like domain-containing protein n=1 Tax=candidate division WWE3 bacterium RIFCSPLOWO2_01_FULL_41_18 TaxID=1802625 RepID=A0A1F4VCW8_UNCKA|nr:MAG: hypothetical protein A2716_03615 [candidate division WWE3 bacterium RIFCSPHIGHO2_01_FULL_40_23]OGC54967.1 MAG: hypothetical protein A3A78_03225 [candidate division WWE3 bacterium RIFCSPLOWO2_01_FULL_41_18]